MKFWRRRKTEPNARVVRDEWLEWLRLSNFSPLTTKGYRLTTDRLLERWPELTFPEFTDERSTMHKEIAKIGRAYFGIEDHGILACYLDFDFGGSGQGTGGHALDEPVHDEDGKFVTREGTAYGMQFLAAVMRAAGVESWDKVQGRTVFALRDREGWGGTIIGIAPLPTETGEEFVFDTLRQKHYAEEVDAVA